MKTLFDFKAHTTTFGELEVGDLFRVAPRDENDEDSVDDSFNKIYMKIMLDNQLYEEKCVRISDLIDEDVGIVESPEDDLIVYPIDATLLIHR